MIHSEIFYSERNQIRRELNKDWRLCRVDLLFGILYAWGGFYIFHRLGLSQVYDVIIPFITISIAMVFITLHIGSPETSGRTVPFYFNLPRDKTIAWKAKLLFLTYSILWMELLVLIGVLLKLGGGGITPYYRLHPECFAIPFLTVAITLWHLYRGKKRGVGYYARLVFAAVLIFGWLYLRYDFSVKPGAANNYLPARDFLLFNIQSSVAMLMVVLTLVISVWTRHNWTKQQIGELK